MQLNWVTRQLARRIELFLSGRVSMDAWVEGDDNPPKIMTSYVRFGTKSFVLDKFVQLLWESPTVVAEALGDNKVIAPYDLDEIVQAVFWLYGQFFPPKDDISLLMVLQGIMEANIRTQDNIQAWLRDNTLFARMFAAYARNCETGRVFLRASLLEPIMKVLEDDLQNLEVDPVKLYQSLPKKSKATLSSQASVEVSVDSGNVMSLPGIEDHLKKGISP